MLTENEMKVIAEKYIANIASQTSKELVILHDYTIKKNYGNIYIYNSKKYLETEDYGYALIGNAPFLVEKKTGKIVIFGTAHSNEYYMKEYEEGRWPNNRI